MSRYVLIMFFSMLQRLYVYNIISSGAPKEYIRGLIYYTVITGQVK